MNIKPVLVRCDASSRIGFGHLVRCLALAAELRDGHGVQVTFAVREDAAAVELIQAQSFAVLTPHRERPFHYADWVYELVAAVRPRVMVLDVRDELPFELVKAVRGEGISIMVIDDPHERRLAADHVFYPPVPQLSALRWEGFTGEVHAGWQWLLLRSQFAGLPKKRINTVPRLLVTMGGSDPAGLTLRAIDALVNCRVDFTVTVVAGPGYLTGNELVRRLGGLGRPFELLSNVRDMAELMLTSDLAIATFGVSAYELAATGTPALLLCLDRDHVASARGLTEAGTAVSLGLHGEVSTGQLTNAVLELLGDRGKRENMASRGQALIDGLGSQRIASLIHTEMERTIG